MSSELSMIEESIKIALDAADAATDVTSEYNKVNRIHQKLEAKIKMIHRYTTIIFVSSIVAGLGAIGFSSIMYFNTISDLNVMTATNREALVIFAEKVETLDAAMTELEEATIEQTKLRVQNESLMEEVSTLRENLATSVNAIAETVNSGNEVISKDITSFGEQISDSLTNNILGALYEQLTEIEKLLSNAQTEYNLTLKDVTTAIPDGSALEGLKEAQLQLATQIQMLQSKSEQMISQIKEKDSQIKYP